MSERPYIPGYRSATVLLTAGLVLFSAFRSPVLAARQSEPSATPSAPLERGIEYFQRGEFEQAEALLRKAARVDPDGSYYLARLYMHEDFLEPRLAQYYLNRARREEPDNPRYLEERLRQLASDVAFFSAGISRVGEVRRLSRRLAEIDSLNPSAHLALGRASAEHYTWLKNRFESGAGPRIRDKLDESLQEALTHLNRAVDLDPSGVTAWRRLIRLQIRARRLEEADETSARMRDYLPDRSESWLLRGLVLDMIGRPDLAASQFERGIDLLEPADSATFDPVHLVYRRDVRDSLRAAGPTAESPFWRSRDPRRLTPVNERIMSHYGRIVYSDLFYPRWRERIDDYWLITPGDVIVRYGYPDYVRQMPRAGGGPNATVTLVIGVNGHAFTFEDWTGSGEFLIPSTANPTTGDGVTGARSTFFEQPEAAAPPGKRVFTAPFISSRFPSADGTADIVVSYGVPLWSSIPDADIPIGLKSGSFLVDSEGWNTDQQIRTWPRLTRNRIVQADTLQLWTEAFELKASPGAYRLQLEVETEEMVSSQWDSLHVDSVGADELILSDLMPATLVEPVSENDPDDLPGIVRNGLRLRPAAYPVFSRRAPLYLYFEVSGLAMENGAANYETQLYVTKVEKGGIIPAIGRLFTGDETRVAASFNTSIESSRDFQYIILDMVDDSPGRYIIELHVRDLTTEFVSETRRILEIRD